MKLSLINNDFTTQGVSLIVHNENQVFTQIFRKKKIFFSKLLAQGSPFMNMNSKFVNCLFQLNVKLHFSSPFPAFNEEVVTTFAIITKAINISGIIQDTTKMFIFPKMGAVS